MYFRIIVLFFMLSGCAAPSGPPPVSSNTAVAVEQYKIGVDDEIQVSVWKNPDLSVRVPVRPDGMISMPLAGDVLAGGRTPEQVASDIETTLSQYVRDPKVAVIVANLRSHEYLSRIRVTGAIEEPNSIAYRQGMTILDAVLAAGGTTEFSAANKTKLYRRHDDGAVVIDVRLGDILTKGELDTNYPLEPGDVITVPQRSF